MTKKVLISTGGSGGHVIPAITIYNHLKHTNETFISTDIRGLAYLDQDYKVFVINTPKLNNYFLLPFSFLKIVFLTVKSFFILKKNNIELQLTEKETELLVLFSKEKEPLSRNFVLEKVWKYSAKTDTHTVETHIHRLRKKILEKFGDNNFIKNNKKGYYI